MSAKEAARLHWEAYAEAFSQPLQANGLLGRFVTNPDVTGAYGEAWIRSITRQMLGLKFRISTGAVTRSADPARGSLKDVPQCDLMDSAGVADTNGFMAFIYFLAQIAGYENLVAT